jgi:nitrate/nitrite transporter NarK
MKSNTNLSLFLACLVGFAFSVNYTNHAPLASALMGVFSFNKAQAGLLTSAIFLTHAIMQIPGGHLADRFGGKRVIQTGLLIITFGNTAISMAGSYEQLIVWKAFIGFGTGISFIGGARYIAQSLPHSSLPKAQGLYGASILLGSGFVIFLVPQLASIFNWSGAFLSTAVIAGSVLIIFSLFAPVPPRAIHPHVDLGEMLSHKELWVLGFLQMASFGLVIVIGTWINELLKLNIGLAPKTAGAVGSIVLLLGIITRTYGGKLVEQIGYRNLIILSILLNITGCFMLAMLGSSFVAVFTAILFLGFGCGLPYAALFSKATMLFPGRAGAAMGLVNMLGIIMILVGSPLLGKIADLTGNFQMAFVALGCFSVLAFVVSLFLKDANKETK